MSQQPSPAVAAPRVHHRHIPETADYGFLPEIKRMRSRSEEGGFHASYQQAKAATLQGKAGAAGATAGGPGASGSRVLILAPGDHGVGGASADASRRTTPLDSHRKKPNYATYGADDNDADAADEKARAAEAALEAMKPFVCVKVVNAASPHQRIAAAALATGAGKDIQQRAAHWEKRLLQYDPKRPKPFDLKCTFGLPRSLVALPASPRGGGDTTVDDTRAASGGSTLLNSSSALKATSVSADLNQQRTRRQVRDNTNSSTRSHRQHPTSQTPQPAPGASPTPALRRSASSFGSAFHLLNESTHDFSPSRTDPWCFADVVAPKDGPVLPTLADEGDEQHGRGGVHDDNPADGVTPSVHASSRRGQGGDRGALSHRSTTSMNTTSQQRHSEDATNAGMTGGNRRRSTRRRSRGGPLLKQVLEELSNFEKKLASDDDSDDEAAKAKAAARNQANDDDH